MRQVQCVKVPIRPGKARKLRSWLRGLRDRSDEVLAALDDEGVDDEAMFFGRDGDVEVVYLMSRAVDLASSARAFQESTAPVDVEFKALMAECLDLDAARPLEFAFAADRIARFVS